MSSIKSIFGNLFDWAGLANVPAAVKALAGLKGSVGQIVEISGTDAQGVATALQAVDKPAGDGGTVPTKVSAFENDAGYQTEAQVNALLAANPTFKHEVVPELPAVGDAMTIYLVPFADDSGSYLEYLWVNGSWEIIGSHSGENPSQSGLSAAMVNALHGMFKVCAFIKDDVSAEYNAFKAAFGISDSGGEEEPDVPTGKTYNISKELVNVTSNNSATSVTEGASYTETLSASVGYTLDGATVTVTMGGVDITSTAYADGVISIASVTGNVEIVASAVVVETGAVLPEDGLIAFFDLRNVDMDTINTAGSTGTAHGIPTATKGSASAYSWGAWVSATDDYGTSISRTLNIGAENTTTQIDLGATYTFVGLTYGGFSACNHGSAANGWAVNPQYTKSDGSAATVGNTVIWGGIGVGNSGYMATITRVNGAELAFFANTEQVATFDGADYDGFAKWASAGNATVTPYTNSGKFTAFALYNRALNDVEIAEAVAYLKTLEVA